MYHGVLTSWARFGDRIEAEPALSLRAFLGEQYGIEALVERSLPLPSREELATDEVLAGGAPGQSSEAGFRVRCLALWGPEALIRAAAACCELQMSRQGEVRGPLIKARDAAAKAVADYLSAPSAATIAAARQSAEACARKYRPFERKPDTPEGEAIWCALGAAWFAAETVAQDWTFQDHDYGFGESAREGSTSWVSRNTMWPARALDAAARLGSEDEAWQAVKAALLAWAAQD